MRSSDELRKYIDSLPPEEQGPAMQQEWNAMLKEAEEKIAEAKRLIQPDYLDDEKIKEHIVKKSKSDTLQIVITIVAFVFIAPIVACLLDDCINITKFTLMIIMLVVGFLLWVPMKFLYYEPRNKRLKEFADQSWHRSVLFESKWEKVRKISTKHGWKYYLHFLNDEKKVIKVEIEKSQYDAFEAIKSGDKTVYVLKCPKYKSDYSYIPLNPIDFENKSSLKIQ